MLPAEPPTHATNTRRLRAVAGVQGMYFLLAGLWPILAIDSFQAVTGRKADLWIVYAVGAVIAAVGTTLLLAALNRRVTAEIAVLGIGSAAVLAAIDVIFVVREVISWVYLLDAAAEVGLVAWWALALGGTARVTHVARYPHVEALLARGRAVAPTGNGQL
jgi:hypothetical protein